MKHISEKVANVLYNEIDYIEDNLTQIDSLRDKINNMVIGLLNITIDYLYNHECELFNNTKDIDTEELGSFIINNIEDLVESVFYDRTNFNLNIKDLIIEGIKVSC